MKLICWNMAAGWGYDPAKHDVAWGWLRAQDPDICLVQEVIVPDWAAEVWGSVVFADKYGKPWGSAVLTRAAGYHRYTPTEAEPWLEHLRGVTCVAVPTDASLPWLVSIHSSASSYKPHELEKLLVEDSRRSLDGVARCDAAALWEIELAAHELRHTLADRAFVAGGDLNSALLFDTNYGGTSNEALFANLAAAGFHDVRPEGQPEQRTFFRPNTDAYQLDHVFADVGTKARLVSWEIDASVAGPDAPSDHAALTLTFD